MKQIILLLITCLLFTGSPAIAQKKDHPMVGQLEGSELWDQNINKIQEYTVITGPIKDDKLVSKIKVLGKTTTTAYRYRSGNSAFGIIHNYKDFFKNNSFKILYSCKSGECGGNISKFYLQQNKLESSDNSVAPAFWDAGYFRNYLSAKKEENGKTVYVCIFIAQGWWSFPVYRVDVVESNPVKTKIVTSDIISKKISNKGSIALYGILFDTGSSNLKPESTKTINQISQHLKKYPNEKFYIVGHTDDAGDFNSNMELSLNRAKSVKNFLVTQYRINSSRLTPQGVGPLCPVATNTTAAGKAKNRRVEMVITTHVAVTNAPINTIIKTPGKSRSLSSTGFSMPDLRGLSLAQAKSKLQIQGISPIVNSETTTAVVASQVTTIPDFNIKFEAVMAANQNKSRHQSNSITIVKTQDPISGTNVNSNIVVTLTTILVKDNKYETATPPPPKKNLIPVPNVVGKIRLRAQSILKKQGFNVKSAGKKVGKVKSQSPGANSRVKPGATITITIGR